MKTFRQLTSAVSMIAILKCIAIKVNIFIIQGYDKYDNLNLTKQ